MLLASASPIKAETEVVTIVDHITSGNSNAINQPEKITKTTAASNHLLLKTKQKIVRKKTRPI